MAVEITIDLHGRVILQKEGHTIVIEKPSDLQEMLKQLSYAQIEYHLMKDTTIQ